MMENLSVSALEVLKRSSEIALRFNHEHVGTEHILLGLVREPNPATEVLRRLEIKHTQVQQAVEELISGPALK